MAIIDIFSKRAKNPPDIFRYDEFPEKLKIQIIYIWEEFFNQQPDYFKQQIYENFCLILCKEYGMPSLWSPLNIGLTIMSGGQEKPSVILRGFFVDNKEIDKSIDVVELVFKYINNFHEIIKPNIYFNDGRTGNISYQSKEAISDLNHRFLENGIGYEFSNGKIIKIDTSILHKEVIKPTLNYLTDRKFKNANEEYLSAHEHYKNQKYKECLNDCLKAFETALKIICEENNWAYNKQKDTANKLIAICLEKGILPNYLNNFISGLRNTLEAGIPTVRNKNSGHGQGTEQIVVPDYLAKYALYLTGSCITFVIDANNNKS